MSPSKAFSRLRNAWSRMLRRLGGARRRVSRGAVFQYTCLAFAVTVSVLIRVLPLRWGLVLSEFDPYFHYEVTKYVVEKGPLAFFSWHSGGFASRTWYPYGRDVVTSAFPGVPFTSAAIYYALTVLGLKVTVYEVCVYFPVIMAALTCVVAYFFGKEVGGRGVGLLSSLFLAVNPAYISRTSLGFFDDETVGILAMLLLFLTYLRALDPNKPQRTGLGYSVVAGLSLGYICASWGAARYPLVLVALFTLAMLVLRRYSKRLLVSYALLMGVGLAIAVGIPRLGPGFLTGVEGVAAVGVFMLLLMYEATKLFKTDREKTVFMVGFLTISGLALSVLGYYGVISLPFAKFMSVINPFTRIGMPLIESVQEHRPATWSAFYYEFGMLVFLVPLGLVFAYRRLTNQNLLMILFTLTTLYAAGSMIRLTILAAPAFCVLGALALAEIIKPLADIVSERAFTRRRSRFAPRVGRGFGLGFILFLFIIVSYPMLALTGNPEPPSGLRMSRVVHSAYSPVTIASSSIPIRYSFGDWTETLTWMRYNLPDDAVVCSWWDYGYWISSVGGKISLADNGTVNGTQIAQIGRMFMSNETQAIAILNHYNTTHVVVFTTLYVALSVQQPVLYGDEVKWRWMARIAGLNDTDLQDATLMRSLEQSFGFQSDQSFVDRGYRLPKGDRVLTKLIVYGTLSKSAPTSPQTLGVSLEHFSLAFASENSMVFVFEVQYPGPE
ncbi:MAG: STT3 domain-containing protein [Candidatus Bathyarchaeia archaeon]